MLLELEWIGYLALSALVVMCLVEWRVQASVEAGKKRDKPEKELRTKEELTAAASELGLDPNDYDGDELLFSDKVNDGHKPLNITMLGQVVRHYTRDKPTVVYESDKAYIPACGGYSVPISDAQSEDVLGNIFAGGDYTAGRPVIEHPTAAENQDLCNEAKLSTRLMVKLALTRELSFYTAQKLWNEHNGPVVWDIPCSAHPALAKMADLYAEMMGQELKPIGPAWDWLLQRPRERAYNTWSRLPLREEDKAMWYTLERYKPSKLEKIVFGRQEYTFGKFRLQKSVRHGDVAAKMVPLFKELGISEEANSGQFFYPPNGFRTWHTNVWDSLGWRGYIVHCDQDNKSALNVMKGDRMITCPDKHRILRLFKITPPDKPTWHSVVSDCNRYSLGVKIPDKVARELFMPMADKTYI